MTYSYLSRPNLDDFIGSDDQKLASALASGINELQISRQVMLTATQTPRNGMTIYGAGRRPARPCSTISCAMPIRAIAS